MNTKMTEPFVLAVSGVKNSGKTTLIKKLIKQFNKKNIKVAVIKHDGHDFSYDVPNTDTYKFLEEGAYATAIFSDNKYMIVKKERNTSVQKLKSFFPDVEIILIEGMKNSDYPKVEVIRSDVSNESVCRHKNLLAIATDLNEGRLDTDAEVFNINDDKQIAEFIYRKMQQQIQCYSAVILAGGKSRRMGRNKADLYLNDRTFLEIQIDKLKSLGFDEIFVSGYKGINCNVSVVKDEFADIGPLGGLYSCLKFMTSRKCLVIPVDVPLIPVDEIKKLVYKSKKSNNAITILSHNGKIEPLIGVYGKEIELKVREAIENNEYSVGKFIKKIGYEVYESTEKDELFENINYYEEYLKLKNNF